jgi:glucose-1-phosphate cytidylyltransferase
MDTQTSNIPVVILCGGQGTRLREETEYKPKPMVPVGERPLLWHLMKLYSHHGLSNFVLCLGYRGEYIKDYFYNYEAMNSDFTVHLGQRRVDFHSSHPEDWRVTLADTGINAMTGARVKRVERYLEAERFCLTYGDGLSDIDIQAVLAFHRAHGKLMTLTAVQPPSRFGQLDFEGDRVSTFVEKPTLGAGYINGGFFVCERGVLDYLLPDVDCVLERAPLERLAADGQLMAYRHDGFWQCMDTVRDVKLLNDLWTSGEAPWRVWDRPQQVLEARVSAAGQPTVDAR